MATVLDEQRQSTTERRLTEELSRTANRIRFNDVLGGVLTLSVAALAYTVAIIVLDRALELPDFARQIGLALFLLGAGTLGYYTVIRPWQRKINPRYAARRVEETIPDAKNVLINWVDLRDRNLPESIHAAVGARAVEGVADADMHRAVESRRTLWLGGAAGLLVAALAVLFVIMKPAPFLSHVARTFNPFANIRIATRTTLTLVEPQEGDVTVTVGKPMTIAVQIAGSVPDPESANRVRLLVRHNPDSADADEFPLEPGETSRDWVIRVPASVIQNGFWYRVAANDATTPEHRVTVRSRPMVRDFTAEYEYPAYTRISKETGHEPALEGIRGTIVKLSVTTNRPVRKGWMQVDGLSGTIPAQIVGDDKQTMQFPVTLWESTQYRIGFTAVDDEVSEPSPNYPIRVLADKAPEVTITSPEPDEISLPANGLLKVDGIVGDDYGIASVALVLHVDGEKIPLMPKKYRNGATLKRESDQTFPTTLSYKDSIGLADLTDSKGRPVPAQPGMLIRYWVEATDNRHMPMNPLGNVGKSKVKVVRVGPIETKPDTKTQHNEDRARRQAEERQHQANQDQQLKTEQRPPQAGPQAEKKEPEAGVAKDTPKEPMNPEGMPPATNPEGKQPPPGTPMPMTEPMNPPPGGAKPPMPNMPPTGNEPPPAGNKPPMTDKEPMGAEGGMKTPDQQQQQPGGSADAKKVKEQADKVQQALREQERQAGQAKSEMPDRPEQAPTSPKKAPPEGMPPTEPKPGEPNNDKNSASAPKSEGKVEPMPMPGEKSPMEKDPNGEKKTEPKVGEPGSEKPMAGQTKPMNPPTRGDEKKPASPGSENQPEETPGTTRGDQPPPRSANKPAPNNKPMNPGDAGDSAKPKPEGPQEPGQEKSQPKSGSPSGPGSPGTGDEKPNDKNSPPPPPPGELSRETGKSTNNPKEGVPEGPPDEEVERLRRKSDDLNSTDTGKRQKAEKEFDDLLGKKDREKLQQKKQEADATDDPMQKQSAKKDIDELTKKAAKNAQNQPTKEQLDQARQKLDDLNSNDAQKRQQAEKDLDQAIGKERRQQIQNDLKDMKSGDPKKEQDAKDRLQDTAKQMAREAKGGEKQSSPPRTATKEEIEQLAKQAEDLNSDDPKKREAAEKKFDQAIGKDQREKMQNDLKDLKSDDPKTRQAAQERIEKAAEQAAGGKNPQDKQPTKEQIEQFKKDAQDLASDDPKKREAAEKKFDQAVGEKNRKDLQQAMKDGKADPMKAASADKKAEDLAQQPKPGMSQEDVEKLAKQAKDLASDDPKKREAAEQAFDNAMGKDQREQIQKEMKDLMSGDPAKAEAAKKRLEEMAKQANEQGKQNRDWRPGPGAAKGQDGQPLEDNPENRLKSAELQLSQFEKNKQNKELLDKLGYTPEEYERFLDGYRQMVERQRTEVENAKSRPESTPMGPATQQVGEGSGGKKLDRRQDGTANPTGGSGPGTAPPGYSDAQRKFAEEAARLRKPANNK